MIRSMTGFGRAESERGNDKFTVEMKSVNNRFLDVSVRMPKIFNPYEASLREIVKRYAERGKIDIYVNYEHEAGSDVVVTYNRAVAKQYADALKEMAAELGIDGRIGIHQLAGYPDVLVTTEEDSDQAALWSDLQAAVERAAEEFVAAREKEGVFLAQDIRKKLDLMRREVAFIQDRAPAIVEEYRRQLTEKVQSLLSESAVDENRIVQEVTIYADRVAVDEELVRLKSHIEAMDHELSREGSIGKKLDFLAQEMNRESNTILSKSDDLVISDHAIELKTCVEKIREQVQNIE